MNGLDDTSITEEAKDSVNITKSRKKICLILHCTETNYFWHADDSKLRALK